MTEKYLLQFNSGEVYARVSDHDKLLLCNIEINIEENKTLAVVGQTGSGKTMTALQIMGLLPNNVYEKNSSLLLCGCEVNSRELLGREIVYIPQNGLESLGRTRKIKNIFKDSLKRNGWGNDLGKARELLSELGFADADSVLNSYPFELSGGMGQRVCIALALCGSPKLVIADEPTNGLDEKGKSDFLELIKKSFPGAAFLIITHDFSLAGLCDEIAVIKDGSIIERGSSKSLLNAPKADYTKRLLAALVKNGMKYDI